MTDPRATPFVLRAAPSTYVVFGAMLGPLAGLWMYLAVTRGGSAWQAVVILAVILGSLFLHFGALRIVVADDVLTYRSLFRTQSLDLKKVVQSRLHKSMGRDTRPFLIIAADQGKELRINIKPFRLEDVRRLLALPQLKLLTEDDVA